MKNTALELHKNGFKIIPTNSPNSENGKKPLCSWKKYQTGQTAKEVEKIFSIQNVGGIALLTGDGIEVIDVDLKYALSSKFEITFFDAILEAIGLETYNKLIISKTINNGYHLIYKTSTAAGNLKLASRYTTDAERKNKHDNIRVLLETRGEGGYILIPPTLGYKYDTPSKDITQISQITDNERNLIIQVCRSFDETQETFKQSTTPTPVDVAGSHKTTIEAFNDAHTCSELLESNGWQLKYTRGGNEHYVRAGKNLNEGIGAGYSPSLNLVRIFTTSTQFEGDKTYNPFQVYAHLNHAGDYKKAAKELYSLGYGDRLKKNRDSYNDKLNALTSANKAEKGKATNISRMEEIFKNRFSIKNVPPKIEYNLFLKDLASQEFLKIASFGDWVAVVGAAKSRKSALANSIAAAILNNNQSDVLNFTGLLQDRNIIVIDTEQNAPDYYTSQKQIYRQAQIQAGTDPSNFYSFCLTDCRMEERLEFLEYVMEKVGNVGVLVLDGIVDICEDYNDQKAVRKLIDHLKVITAKHNTLFIPILHNARSTGSARGHLGTELINKSKAVIKVTKDKDYGYSQVEFEYLRGQSDPAPFNFGHDSNGNLILF